MLADSTTQLNSRTQFAWSSLAAILVAALLVGAAHAAEQADTIRLRIAWGGDDAVRWAGRISIDDGQLTDVALLGRERDTPGSIWTESGSVLIAQPRARTFDGVDVTAHASLDATLRVVMQAAGEQQPTVIELPLAELMKSQHRRTLLSGGGSNQTTLLVHRAQADSLRIHTERPDLVFEPGETFRFELEPAIASLPPGGSLDLSAEVQQGRRGAQQWQSNLRIALPLKGYARSPVEIPLPQREGVYTIKLAVRNPPGNRVKFWETSTGPAVAERSFQVLVLDDSQTKDYTNVQWRTQLEIDPAHPKWWQRLPNWTRLDRLTNLASGPMGSGEPEITNQDGKAYAKLVRSKAERPTWQAYPLPAAEPGKPHIVEVDLPVDYTQQLVVRIYEPNASGKLVANGPGSGVVVDNRFGSNEGSVAEVHRYLFWPRTKSPVVVIQNASNDSSAAYGKIKLRVASENTVTARAVPNDKQVVSAYYAWDALAERTAVRPPPTSGRVAMDDLLTFYEMAERLADLLELSGYNAATVNVMRDGGAAFAMDTANSLPVMNSSRIASGANDLPEANPTELILRLLSRRGLRLTPTLRFNATLPIVERHFRDGKYSTLEDYPIWTDLNGSPRRSALPESPDADVPHYLAMHPDVSSEISDAVSRLAKQAAAYPAFAGVGLEFSSDSFLPAPPSRFGVTGPRLARLATVVGVDQSTLNDWISKPNTILADAKIKKAWDAQRAESMTRFLESLSSNLQQVSPKAPLVVLGAELFDAREFAVRPQAGVATPLKDLYLERGVDVRTLQETPNIHFTAALHQVQGLPLADATHAMELNSRRSDDQLSGGIDTTMNWMHAAHIDTPRGEAFAPERTADHKLLFDRTASHSTASVTRMLYDSPARSLILGGSQGPGSLACDELRQLLQQLAALPIEEKATIEGMTEQPVVARVYRSANQTVAVVANDSPWPVRARITLEIGQRTTATPIATGGENTTATETYAAGQHAWPLDLSAYAVRILRFSEAEVAVTGIQLQIAPAAAEQLATACTEIESRDLKPDQLATYSAVANPSFEDIDKSGLATNWQGPNGVATVTPGVNGERAAQLVSSGKPISIATDVFATPATGQIAVTAYVRVLQIAQDAKLRLLVEEVDSVAPPRFIELSASLLNANQENKEWNVYQFGVEDLPFDSTAKMRLRVELSGAGEVWIDNFLVHDLVYPLRVYEKESDQQVLALIQHVKATRSALDAQRLHDCLTLVESYWTQFLLQHLPEIEAPPAGATSPTTNVRSESAESTPRLSDRMRDWFRF